MILSNAGLFDRQFICLVLRIDISTAVCIPMGTYCATPLSDLFLHSYEAKFIQNHLKDKKNKYLAKFSNFTFRYIDDVLSLNNPYFSQY